MRKRTRFVVSLIWRFLYIKKNRPGQTRQTRRLALSTDRTPLLPRPVDAASLVPPAPLHTSVRVARRRPAGARDPRGFLLLELFSSLRYFAN